MKRYMLHPGWIPTVTGGAEYVSPSDLARLYQVKRSECWVSGPKVLKSLSPDEFASLIHLYPDRSGRYQAPRR